MSAIDKALRAETKIKLASCAVRDPVPFGGPATTTMVAAAHGTLELDLERRVVICTPRDATRDTIIVPMENVKFYIELSEKHLAKLEAQKAATGIKPVPKPVQRVPVKNDVVKFVKDPVSGKPMIQNPDGSLSPFDPNK